ncbi:MAG: CDP-diacylglycerol--serine O-phosphatidyltransferase [Bacteroidota bacterium]
MKKHLPNFFTLLNLTIGGLGTILAFNGNLKQAVLCIWIGAFLDFFDGWLARMLKVYTPLGQQLDSLADLLTFGWLPASIVYMLISQRTTVTYLPYIALLIPNCSALRLAKFNIDTRQKDVFIGLPVPANGILISTLPLMVMANRYAWLTALLNKSYTLVVLVIITSYLLIANTKLMAFKFTSYNWYPNRFRYSFLLIAALLILLLQIEGLALSIVLYVLASYILSILQEKR